MPLLNATCPNCGAVLEVDSSKEAAICQYCGSAYVVEKAINNYKIENHNTISSEVVNIYNSSSETTDFVIKGRILEKYIGAEETITIPDSVEIVGERAFEDNERLKEVLLPESVVEIREAAFAYCTSLKSITIPQKVKRIEKEAFFHCLSLSDVQILGSDISISEDAFLLSAFVLPEKYHGYSIGKNELSITCFDTVSNQAEKSLKLRFYIRNKSQKTINKILLYVIPKNRIGEPVRVFQDQKSDITMLHVLGPVSPGKERGWSWSWYSPGFEKASIHSLVVVYSDSSKALFSGESLEFEKGACYIATAVYGSYNCPQVWTLRRYRDFTLSQTWYGRTFIRFYYAISPILVFLFGKTKWFKKLWKPKLDRMIRKLNSKGVLDTPYEDLRW